MVNSTQFLRFTNDPATLRKIEQSATKIYLQPAESDIHKLAKLLSTDMELNWNAVIKQLSKGKCIVKNGLSNNNLDKLVYVCPIDKLLEEIYKA